MLKSLLANCLQNVAIINVAVEELLKSKKHNNGRVCKNGYSEALQSLKEMGVNIGVDELSSKWKGSIGSGNMINHVMLSLKIMAHQKSLISLLIYCQMKIILTRMMIVPNLQRSAVAQKRSTCEKK